MQEVAAGPAVTANLQAVASFVAYLAIVIGIGVYATRFSSSGVAEFFVGGRRMHRFVVALSAVVSGRSAWLLLGVTGMAYVESANGSGPVGQIFYMPRTFQGEKIKEVYKKIDEMEKNRLLTRIQKKKRETRWLFAWIAWGLLSAYCFVRLTPWFRRI